MSENNNKIADEKYSQIISYYSFHKEIESYFNEGFNKKGNGIIQDLYFIDEEWLLSWKAFCNYENVIQNLDKGKDYLINSKILNNNDEYIPHSIKSGKKSKEFFLSRFIYCIEDFNCIINEGTYKLFRNYFDNFLVKYLNGIIPIQGILYDKILVLLFEEEKIIKIFYKGELENNIELIQLNLEFINYCSNDIVEGIISIFYDDCPESFGYFKKKYISKNSNTLMNLLIKENVGYIQDVKLKYDHNKKVYCKIRNCNLYKKYFLKEEKNGISSSYLKNVNNERFIGLENIGATCYMNATIQCLVNINELTKYLLIEDIFNKILNEYYKCDILNSYCILLEKLCCDEKITHYYSPKQFKDIISLKNPLFKGIQANDSKDLIYFLIEQMNYEFNKINIKIKDNISDYNNKKYGDQLFSDRNLMLKSFISEYSYNNNNIISKLFFSLIENETTCGGCNTRKFNFQSYFSLEFILENIYNKIYANQNKNISNKNLSLEQCFENYNETNFLKGENALYCNKCKCQQNSTYITRIYSLSPIIIIILNRGKGNSFKCHVDFPESINVQKYVQCPINANYSLIGVVSHLGSSDMSGHFIAYCRHRINKKWYCYNDATVVCCSDQKNDFKKGVPYILFYESTQGAKNLLFDEDYLNNKNNSESSMPNNTNNNFKNTFNSLSCNYNNNFNNIPNNFMNNSNNNFNMNTMAMNMSMNNMNTMAMSMNNMNMMTMNMNNNMNNINYNMNMMPMNRMYNTCIINNMNSMNSFNNNMAMNNVNATSYNNFNNMTQSNINMNN